LRLEAEANGPPLTAHQCGWTSNLSVHIHRLLPTAHPLPLPRGRALGLLRRPHRTPATLPAVVGLELVLVSACSSR
jgi:hypothetical protein